MRPLHSYILAKPSEMTVTWVTFNNTNSSVVEYGKTKLSMVAKGTVDLSSWMVDLSKLCATSIE